MVAITIHQPGYHATDRDVRWCCAAGGAAPGVIKTRFSRVLWQTPQMADPILAHLPLGRFGEPEDVAGLALYLASRPRITSAATPSSWTAV